MNAEARISETIRTHCSPTTMTLSTTYREFIHSNITLSGFPRTSAFLLAAVSTEITKQPVPIFEIFDRIRH